MKEEIRHLVTLRSGLETDHSFVYATWLRGLYYGNSFFRQIDKDEFMERYTLIVQNLLFKASVQLAVACLKEEHDTILGYSLLEKIGDLKVVHWVFVKPEWRKVGICTSLVPEDADTITHIVDSLCHVKLKDKAKSDKWLSNYDVKLKNKKLQFKPFLV